jgi:hypothetical protein
MGLLVLLGFLLLLDLLVLAGRAADSRHHTDRPDWAALLGSGRDPTRRPQHTP